MPNATDLPADPAPSPAAPPPVQWLVRISEVFSPLLPELLAHFSPVTATPLGSEYHLLKTTQPGLIHSSPASLFLRWNLPVHHSWPCHPQKMEGFVEKAAQTLLKKFADRHAQALLIGQLTPGSPQGYYKGLASNLRGRALQLFPAFPAATAEDQDPARDTLFSLVGREGLFSGIQSPRASGGLHPGGTKFIGHEPGETISRAGAKIAEALHHLLLHHPMLPPGTCWLELGASPGGMTSELLARGHHVTAVDRAPLHQRLDRHPGLTFVRSDAASFQPRDGAIFDALLCDLNGDALDSLNHVRRLAPRLRPGGLVVFTLKTSGASTVSDILALHRAVISAAAASGLRLLTQTHLTYNRLEFTLFFQRIGD